MKYPRQIHIPDSLTGFCYKCGKTAFVYGKYCDELTKACKANAGDNLEEVKNA